MGVYMKNIFCQPVLVSKLIKGTSGNRKTIHYEQVRDLLTRQMPLSGHLDKNLSKSLDLYLL